jgi:glycosyltransferase involved in cell wall biosynthesis
VLFTNVYPFGSGEEFLEPEIPYLAEAFEAVILVPTLKAPAMVQTRQVPAGVEVRAVDISYSRAAKAVMAARGILKLLAAGRSQLPGPGWRGDGLWAPARDLVRDVYFREYCRTAARRIEPLLRDLESSAGEVLFYSYWFHKPMGIAAELRCRLFTGNRPRIISRGHRYDVDVTAAPHGFLPARERLLSEAERVYVVSRPVAARMRSDHPIFATRIGVSRLGSADFASRVLSSLDSRQVVSCSAIHPLKRLDLIARAIGILRRRGVPVEWTHIGGAPRDVDATRFVELVRAEIGDPSSLPIGPLSHEAVLQWYRDNSPSVFVNTSASEGVPVSVMEAMCGGIPVIATSVGGTSDLLVGTLAEGLIPADADAATLADQIERVLALEPGRYAGLADQTRRTWAEGWDTALLYPAFVRSLLDLASGDH